MDTMDGRETRLSIIYILTFSRLLVQIVHKHFAQALGISGEKKLYMLKKCYL